MLIRDVAREDVEWDSETDLLIVGGGGAGLVAAVAATDHDVDVRIQEKQGRLGGNTLLSHATTLAAGTIPQADAGIEDSPAALAEDLLQYTGSDEALTRKIAAESGETIDWLIEDVGIDFRVNTTTRVDGCRVHRSHFPVADDGTIPENGEPLIETLEGTARERGVEIELGAGVEQLAVTGDRVVGTVTEGNPTEVGGLDREAIRAGKVLLATNGVCGNRELRREMFPRAEGLEYWGARGITGDGYRWAERLGARVEMSSDAVSIFPLVSSPEGFHLLIDLGRQDGTVILNERCEQFGDINTAAAPLHFSYQILDQPGNAAYVIFDREIFDELIDSEFTVHRFTAAVEEGVFETGESLEELAETLSLDPQGVRESVDRINTRAGRGELDEVGRRRDRALNPPYFGTKVKPAVVENAGGVVVDTGARVIDEAGEPIPNLYAAGSVTAGISGLDAATYIPGTRMMNVLTLGRLMGKGAARAVEAGRGSTSPA